MYVRNILSKNIIKNFSNSVNKIFIQLILYYILNYILSYFSCVFRIFNLIESKIYLINQIKDENISIF